MTSDLLIDSLKDTSDDIEELLYLYKTTLEQLETFVKVIKKQKRFLLQDTYDHVSVSAYQYITTYQKKIALLVTLQKSLKQKPPGLSLLTTTSKTIEILFDLYRTNQNSIASLITATDFQSPSFLQSTQSMAGRQTGKIIGMINDYKRDQHLDEKEYENMFVKQYVDGFIKLPIHSYLTNSGMAAFTTILNFLQMETKLPGPILMGKASYFENKELTTKILKNNIILVDEMDTKKILQTIKNKQPSVLIFDSLCNAADIPVPNIGEIIAGIKKYNKKDVYFILDNTCLTFSLQIFQQILGKTTKIHLLVLESLNKYHQFGMDRVTAGIIWAYGKNTGKLFSIREHSGTNINDTSCYMLPKPNRKMLHQRLKRFERNAMYIASELEKFLQTPNNNYIEKIVYPGLPSHPSFPWTKQYSFHGSFLSIRFTEKKKTTAIYKRFIALTIKEAKKEKINIVSGTSFGFNTSRIYLTSSRSDFGEPFIRFSAGTENKMQIEKVKKVLMNAVQRL